MVLTEDEIGGKVAAEDVTLMKSDAAQNRRNTHSGEEGDASNKDESAICTLTRDHKLLLDDLPTYLLDNPTCRILFFNDLAYRPGFVGTAANRTASSAIVFDEIPWAIVDLNVCHLKIFFLREAVAFKCMVICIL